MDPDAVLLLGTGKGILGALLIGLDEDLKPAISCNLALAWSADQCQQPEKFHQKTFETLCRTTHWRGRYTVLRGLYYYSGRDRDPRKKSN